MVVEEGVEVVVNKRRPWLLAWRERRDEELDDGKGEQRLRHVTMSRTVLVCEQKRNLLHAYWSERI
jgi:hypothetical protein